MRGQLMDRREVSLVLGDAACDVLKFLMTKTCATARAGPEDMWLEL